MSTLPLSTQTLSVTDVYTNLHGLQAIKQEQSDDVALKKIAQQFESLFINMMMKNMRSANAVFEEDSLFNSQESQFYRDLLDQQQALTLSHGRGLGIADALYRQMMSQYGGESTQVAPTSDRSVTLPLDLQGKHDLPSTSSDINTATEPTHLQHDADNRVSLASSPQEFVNKFAPFAREAAEKIGVDENILLAQSALETGWGQFVLADRTGNSSNNLFNIKRGSHWNSEVVRQPTVEYSDGIVRRESADFRVYKNVAQSFDDYVKLVSENERYRHAVAANNHESYIRNLHDAGYATDPDYSDKVLSVYRRIALLSKEDVDLASDDVNTSDARQDIPDLAGYKL